MSVHTLHHLHWKAFAGSVSYSVWRIGVIDGVCTWWVDNKYIYLSRWDIRIPSEWKTFAGLVSYVCASVRLCIAPCPSLENVCRLRERGRKIGRIRLVLKLVRKRRTQKTHQKPSRSFRTLFLDICQVGPCIAPSSLENVCRGGQLFGVTNRGGVTNRDGVTNRRNWRRL